MNERGSKTLFYVKDIHVLLLLSSLFRQREFFSMQHTLVS